MDVDVESNSSSDSDDASTASDDDADQSHDSAPLKTPFLSPASSASSASYSSLSSLSPTPPLCCGGIGSPLSSVPSTPEPETQELPAKALTRRQRKKLGLPKPHIARAGSAGKIVIPGGRYLRNRNVVVRAPGEPEQDEDGEWKRNGSGRVDVRGFRELKI